MGETMKLEKSKSWGVISKKRHGLSNFSGWKVKKKARFCLVKSKGFRQTAAVTARKHPPSASGTTPRPIHINTHPSHPFLFRTINLSSTKPATPYSHEDELQWL